MKKQLLIAAVAATMSATAMADLSITGNAKYEYFNTETSTTTTNTANTEANLKLRGSTGDTAIVMDLEANTSGQASTAGALDIEDLYVTTKIGDINVKAGNYASSTSGILGEIDNGGRISNKLTVDTTINGVKIYVGNSNVAENTSAGPSQMDGNMFFGVSTNVAGWDVEAKHVSPTVDAFKIAGEVEGLGIRLEQKQNDAANSDVTFGNLTYSVGEIDLGYAFLDVDNTDSLVEENDSSIFAVENGIAAASSRDNAQVTLATDIQGNTVTFKNGKIDKGINSSADLDYQQISVKRALASGATATVLYTDKDDSATTDTQILEVEVSVNF